MLARGKGSIINMSSIGGVRALGRGNFAYSIGQAGVIQMTRELSTEWADRGVRVNAIAPAQITNPGFEVRMDNTPGLRETVPARHPDGPPGRARRHQGPRDVPGLRCIGLRHRLGVRRSTAATWRWAPTAPSAAERPETELPGVGYMSEDSRFETRPKTNCWRSTAPC